MKYSQYEIRFVTVAPVYLGGGKKDLQKNILKVEINFIFHK